MTLELITASLVGALSMLIAVLLIALYMLGR